MASRVVFHLFVGLGAAAILLPDVSTAGEPDQKSLPVFFCAPAGEVAKKVEDCEDNDAFIAKGEECLDRLEKEVASVAQAMKGGFAKDSEQKQNTKFQSTNHDYALTSRKLAYLIGVAGLAIGQVEEYKNALLLPEDADEPDVNGGDREKFLREVECYGDSKDSLTDIGADFQEMLKQLEAAKQVADAHAATSGERKTGMDAGNAEVQKAATGKVKAGAKIKIGRSPAPKSDVTGVREAIEKDKKQK